MGFYEIQNLQNIVCYRFIKVKNILPHDLK